MKTAKLFQNGQSQAVRLPKEFRFDDSEVFIKKTGNIVQLIPAAILGIPCLGALKSFPVISWLNVYSQSWTSGTRSDEADA